MSGLFGGSGSGPKGSENVNIPPFTSSGGITPDQQALAQYGYGEDLLAQGNLFGSSGTGMSTMDTQGATGARNQMAMTQAGMSDTDESAMYNLYTNDVSAEEQQLANNITFSNQNQSLGSLANQAAGFQNTVNSGGTGT